MSDIVRIDQNARRSRAVVHNGIVYMAGQVPDNRSADVADQTRQVLAKVDDLLKQAGTDKSRVLSAQIWLKTMDDFDAMNAVWDPWVVQGQTPARLLRQGGTERSPVSRGDRRGCRTLKRTGSRTREINFFTKGTKMIDRGSSDKVSAANSTTADGCCSDHPAGFRMRRITAIRGMLSAALVAMLPLFAFSQMAVASEADSYPNKSIKLVVPYGTGGVSDSVGRVLAAALSEALGKSVYVENRGGGGGTIGAAVVAKSPPDGYTILLTSPPMVAVAPVLLRNLSYDAVEEFTPIGTFVTTPNILVVNSSLPVTTMAELVAYAKGEGKGKLSFGSAGPGSTGHLSGQILQTTAGIEMTHVPYKSSALAFPDVLAGRVSMVFDSVPSTIGHVRSGRVRPIAVMSEKRSPVLPDVPTAAESGFPATTMVFWMGIEGPPKLPPAIVDKLNAALRASVDSQSVRDHLAKLGAEPFLNSPQEFNALRRRDVAKLRQLVKEIGLRPE